MKKIFGILFALVIAAAAFGCTQADNSDKVELRYVSEGSVLVGNLAANKTEIGVLGEPAATAATKNADCKELFDLQEEFKKASNASETGYPQASLIANGAFLEANAAFVNAFVAQTEENLEYLKTNYAEASETIQAHDGAKMALTPTVIERMNLRVVSASDSKAAVERLLGLFGIAAPADGFYWPGSAAADTETDAVNVVVPDGSPALAIANVMKAGKVGDRTVNVEIVNAQALQARLKSGDYDLAMAPTNMAATMYTTAKKDLKLVTTNTYGVLYMMGKNSLEIKRLEDLKGKCVTVIGQGQIPDLVLRYILDQAGIEYFTAE